jgi:hypothetical protein
VPSPHDHSDAAASQFVAALGGAMAAANYPVTMVRELLGTHSTAVFTATLISMMSIAVGVQTGLLLWRASIQLTPSPDRRALHD